MPLFVLPTVFSLIGVGYFFRAGGVPVPLLGSVDVWGWLMRVAPPDDPTSWPAVWEVVRDNLLFFLIPFTLAELMLYVEPQRSFFRPFKFNKRYPAPSLIFSELLMSLRGVLIGAALEVAAATLYRRGLAPAAPAARLQSTYTSALEIPISSALLGGVLLYLWGDFHFYATHRLLHINKWLYKHVHSVHHRSYNPDPYSGLSMHPIESAIYFSAGILTAAIAPWYMCRIMCKGLIIFPLEGHSGYGIKTSPNSTFHYDHHSQFNYNYGSSWLWDWMGGTLYVPRHLRKGPDTAAQKKQREAAKEMAALVGQELPAEGDAKSD